VYLLLKCFLTAAVDLTMEQWREFIAEMFFNGDCCFIHGAVG
jgi:hypothetical protein